MANSKGIKGMGVVRIWRPCHFGRKPRKGGRPAREKNIRVRACFRWLERDVRDEILGDERLSG